MVMSHSHSSGHEQPGMRNGRDAVTLSGVWKSYGGIPVLKGIDLTLQRGQIHGLAGENGAGKSTCVAIMSGKTMPTRGSVTVGDASMTGMPPRAFRRRGVSAVYQELTMLPRMTALDNVFVGIAPTRIGGVTDRREMKRQYDTITARLGVSIPATALVGALSTGDQQMLEIARAMARQSSIILFDEPTAALSMSEKDRLLAVMDQLRDDGVAMALVTHDLSEMQEITDRITVFRDGSMVESRESSRWSTRELVSAMAGGHPPERLTADRVAVRARQDQGAPLLSISDGRLDGKDFTLDLEIRQGEIVGIAGLMGSGRSSLVKSLAGEQPLATGLLSLDGRQVRWPRFLSEGRHRGLHYLPEDRKSMGLILQASVVRNVTLGSLGRTSFGPWVLRRRTKERVRSIAGQVRLRDDVLDAAVARLSGGNQQKVLLGRALARPFKVLLADEPTRGVDVNAREEIWSTIASTVAAGKGALVVVSDIDELAAIADRIVVIPRHGHCVTMPGRGRSSRGEIVEQMFK